MRTGTSGPADARCEAFLENQTQRRQPLPHGRGSDWNCDASIRAATVRSCEGMRPQAGVGKLKHAPPMQANDLPLVAQAVAPANHIFSHHLRERLPAARFANAP